MFIAKSKTGEYISLFHQPHHQLIRLKENGPFFCPACDQELILKVGAKKIPHFAHKTLCPIKPEGVRNSFIGEEETIYMVKTNGFST